MDVLSILMRGRTSKRLNIYIMNTRIYGIEIDDTEIDYINCSDNEFIEEAETHGLVWEDIDEFLRQINKEEINTKIIQFRAIRLTDES